MTTDIYQGVVPVTVDVNGHVNLGGSGCIVDWLVQMKRLPTERSLEKLHLAGELRGEHIDQLADTLVKIYLSLPKVELSPQAYRDRYLKHVHGNQLELLADSNVCPRQIVQRVNGFQAQLLNFRPEMFDRRIAEGRIVEGHGDLRPEHICFSDPINIFDCIEFNEEFRQLDIADELAFLATECDFIGAHAVATGLVPRFQSLIDDRPPSLLLDFYKSYRATVRAKVAAIRCCQITGPEQAKTAAEANTHLTLADEYARPHYRPFVVAVGGASGTGKSTLANALAKELCAEVLHTDVLRREMMGTSEGEDAVDGGRYRPEVRAKVYREMLRRAAEFKKEYISVILDATFSDPDELQRTFALLGNDSSFTAIECHCRPEVAKSRIINRLQCGCSESESRPDVLKRQLQSWQAWRAEIPQIRVDTERPDEEAMRSVIAELSRRTSIDGAGDDHLSV